MTKQSSKLILSLGVIAIMLASLFRLTILNKQNTIKINTSSVLIDAINIADLSTAEFKYRGIAEVYTDEKKTKVHCRICYNSIVKAGIDMEKVKFDVDTDNKTIKPILPAIDIKVTIVDEKTMAVLPSNAEVGLDVMLKYSREDAEREAGESAELMATARENLETTIEGLLFPILKPQGYKVIWK